MDALSRVTYFLLFIALFSCSPSKIDDRHKKHKTKSVENTGEQQESKGERSQDIKSDDSSVKDQRENGVENTKDDFKVNTNNKAVIDFFKDKEVCKKSLLKNTSDLKKLLKSDLDDFAKNYVGSARIVAKEGLNQLCFTRQGEQEISKCVTSYCPFGQVLVKNQKGDGVICKDDASLCKKECKTCLRGICLDEKNKFIKPIKRSFKLALYHGGIVGEAATNGEVYKKYIKDIKNFVANKKIDIVFFVLNSWPLQSKSKEGVKFGFYKDPNFLSDVMKEFPKDVEFGVVAYLRPKDADWDIDTVTGFKNKTEAIGYGGWEDGSPDDKDNKILRPKKIASINGNRVCNWFDDECKPRPCPQEKDDATGASLCKKVKESTKGKCPAGCPNSGGQVVQYIKWVNDHINKDKIRTNNNLITYLSFDGEDGGPYQMKSGFSQLRKIHERIWKNDKKKAPKLHLGYAKALNSGIVGKDNNYVLPEAYWFMNIMGACGGNPDQLKGKMKICTAHSAYRVFKDKPISFLKYWQSASYCSPENKDHLKNLRSNIEKDKEKIWAMFSFENLSRNSPASNCLAYNYAKSGAKPQVCGTFDGFSHWQWDKFELFMEAFKLAYYGDQKNVVLGLYESQFIPPHWLKDSRYESSDFKPDEMLEKCNSLHASIPCSKDSDCVAKDQSCKPKESYCKNDNGFCHFRF